MCKWCQAAGRMDPYDADPRTGQPNPYLRDIVSQLHARCTGCACRHEEDKAA